MAVQIARTDNGHLHVSTDVIGRILGKVGAHPLVVIAVSGPLHSGKSNIINHLLHAVPNATSNDDHQTKMAEALWNSSSCQPNEILMWPEPLMAIHKGTSTAVLLMSVHGNPDGTAPTIDTALIFAFGSLLSSVLIYHVKRGFSKDMLQLLQMTSASAKTFSRQEGCHPIAKLLFVVNDWQYPGDYVYGFHDDHSSASMRNFKKDKLDMVLEDRMIRQDIMNTFQEVCCCLVPKFGDEMFEGVGPLQDLGTWIFGEGSSVRKAIQGWEVTGIELEALMQKWARTFVLSEIQSVGSEVEVPIAMALSMAHKFFVVEMTRAINGPGNLSIDQLCMVHTFKKQEAMTMFKRLTITWPPASLGRRVDLLNYEFDAYYGLFLHMLEQKNCQPPLPVTILVQDPCVQQKPIWKKIWFPKRCWEITLCFKVITCIIVVMVIAIKH